ncbi:MAG: hypothetical protein K2L54_02610 [Clostridiales bacterium]|nr:hypothetical protein [Clostridiales bacterium]
MITTKRQIRRDTDRFGGYGTESARSAVISDYDNIGNFAEPSAERNYNAGNSLIMTDADVDIRNAEPKSAQPAYTTLTSAPPAIEKRVIADVPPRPVKEQTPREREDILPTVKTRKYATERHAEEEKPAEASVRRERRALQPRTKVLLCVYIAVALVLAIAVIATGVSISRATAQADMIVGQISQKQAVIAEQEKTLATVLDADAIRGKAEQLGMVSAGNPTYTAPDSPTVEYPEADPHTNWFDKFCEWTSKVFG